MGFECLGRGVECLRNWSLERDKFCLTNSKDILKMKCSGDVRLKLWTFVQQLHMN